MCNLPCPRPRPPSSTSSSLTFLCEFGANPSSISDSTQRPSTIDMSLRQKMARKPSQAGPSGCPQGRYRPSHRQSSYGWASSIVRMIASFASWCTRVPPPSANYFDSRCSLESPFSPYSLLPGTAARYRLIRAATERSVVRSGRELSCLVRGFVQ